MASIHPTVLTGDYFDFYTDKHGPSILDSREYDKENLGKDQYFSYPYDVINTTTTLITPPRKVSKSRDAPDIELYKDSDKIENFVIGNPKHVYIRLNNLEGQYYMIKFNGSLRLTQDTDGTPIYKPIAQEDSFGKKICDALTPGCLKTRSRVHADAGGSKKRAKKTRKQRKPRKSKRNHKK